jgi:polyisoprenoid-binding protein YceI
MQTRFLSRSLSVAVLGAALLAAASPGALASDWSVDHANSRLAFVAQQNGAPVEGVFSDWSAEITLDPADLSTARIVATVKTGSAATGQAQIDGTLPGAAWFDTAATPEAVFSSSSIKATGANAYEAQGTLAIKGKEMPFTLPFTLDIDGDAATAHAQVPLSRLAYGVGSDMPASTVAEDVKVVLDISATR